MQRRKPFEDYDPDRFISGVYNYCDRWCERCRFSTRCLVYHEEQQRTAEHLLNDEDPYSMETVLSDVSDSFAQTMEMLQEMAEEMGVDLDAIDDEDDLDEEFEDENELEREPVSEMDAPHRVRRMRGEGHPLYKRATALMDRVEKFAERVREEMPAAGEELSKQVMEDAAAGIDLDENAIIGGLNEAKDAYMLLCRYRFLILAKMMRAITGMNEREPAFEGDEPNHDALSTAKLVDECLGKVIDALWALGEFRRDWLDDALPISAEANSIRQELPAVFPGFRDMIRPGFDTEPE